MPGYWGAGYWPESYWPSAWWSTASAGAPVSSLDPALLVLLTQSVTHTARLSLDAYGHWTYGTSHSYPARVSGKSQMTRDDQGRDVLATTVAWVATTAVIHTEDRITLLDGSEPLLLRVERYLDERGAVHHQQLYFG